MSPGTAAKVRYERRGHVGLLLLADGARRNALSSALVGEVRDVMRSSREANVRALVLGSAGPVFCAGADMAEMMGQDWSTWIDPDPARPTPLDLFEALEADPRPMIAAVDGPAFGGGVELTLACDLVVASEKATFMLPELAHGAIPNTAMARLPALVGLRAARDLVLTRRKVTAQEALAMGLISRLHVDATPLHDAAVALAESIVVAPPAALAAAKHAVPREPDWKTIRALLRTMRPDEYNEGFAAFVEKRRPDFDSHWRPAQRT